MAIAGSRPAFATKFQNGIAASPNWLLSLLAHRELPIAILFVEFLISLACRANCCDPSWSVGLSEHV
jgi:hypothetical protein